MSAPASGMHSDAARARAAALGLTMGRPNLEVFAEELLAVAREDCSVVVVTSDSRGSGKLAPYGEALPAQIVEVGIAEQNLVGIAAGLASAGRKPFAVSPACFLSARALEQVKNDVAYADHPVRLVGISAGVSYGALGSTHHSLHDFAALRAIHNVAIVAPGDNAEARRAVRAAAASDRPVYLRFGKAPLFDLPESEAWTGIERARVVREGRDGCFLASGETVIHALLAADALASEGIDCRVVSLPTVKPLDREGVLAAGRECEALVTVEEHSVHGGLGEGCAAVLLEAGLAPRFRIVGLPDDDTMTGSQADIFRHYGITMEGLAETMRRLLARATRAVS